MRIIFFMIPNPTIFFTIAFIEYIFPEYSVVQIHALIVLPMHVFVFDFKMSTPYITEISIQCYLANR